MRIKHRAWINEQIGNQPSGQLRGLANITPRANATLNPELVLLSSNCAGLPRVIRAHDFVRRLLRAPRTARASNQSIQKEISPECSLEGLTLKLILQSFGHLM